MALIHKHCLKIFLASLLIFPCLPSIAAAGPEDLKDLSTTWIGPVEAGQKAQLAVSWQGEPGVMLSVWIDFDDDDIFEEAEKALEYRLATGLQTVDLEIPAEARISETTQMRLEVVERSKHSARATVRPLLGKSASHCEWEYGFHRPGFVTGNVRSSIMFDDGSGPALYIGGQFDSIDGVAADRIAKWDGHQWSAVGEGITRGIPNESVLALTTHSSGNGPELFAAVEGYDFRIDGGPEVGFIVRWDGSEWADVADTKGAFRDLISFDDGSGPILIAAGNVHQVDEVNISDIARWDGDSWQDLAPEINSTFSNFETLEIFNSGQRDDLYAGGTFRVGSSTYALAKWDGTAWTYLLPLSETNSPHYVFGLKAFDDGTGEALFVAGSYILEGSRTHLAKWDGNVWSNPVTLPDANNYVTDLEIHNTGSGLELFGGQLDGGLGKWNQGQWDVIPGEFDNGVWTLASASIDELPPVLFAGGSFKKIADLYSPFLVQWDGSQWHETPASSPPGKGRLWPIYSLKTFNDGSGSKLYAAGIDREDGLPKVLAWDGVDWSDVGIEPLDAARGALEVFNDGNGEVLYATGNKFVRQWNGSTWDSVGPAPNSLVTTLVADPLGENSGLFAGGYFTEVGGIEAKRVARWDGAEWHPLGTGLDGWVGAMSIHDDHNGSALYVAGEFKEAGGVSVNNIARWDGTQWSAVGAGFEHRVIYLASHDDGSGPALFAGSSYWQAPNSVVIVSKWNGEQWTVINTANSAAGFPTPMKTYDDGTGPALYSSGNFNIDGEEKRNILAKWNGSSWAAVAPGTNERPLDLEVYDDGTGAALYAGGSFGTVGSIASTGLAKWTCPQGADLRVSLQEADPTLVAGTPTAFEIAVENLGCETAPLATLQAAFPTELSCSWTTSVEGDVTGHQKGSGPVLDQVLSIPPSGGVTYAVECQVDSGATGKITNTVTVTADNDPNATNNIATDTDTITQENDLQVRVGNGFDDLIFPGGTVTYALTVTNLGPSDTPSTFELSSAFPVELSRCRWFDHRAGDAVGQNGGSIQQTLSLAAHDSARYVVTCRVPIDASGTISFSASLDPGDNPDPNVDNNQATDTDSVQDLGSRNTLILAHFGRLQAKTDSSAEDMEALLQTTYQFAAHAKVRGLVLDLGIYEDLAELYGAWDQDTSNGSSHPDSANRILFGCLELCGDPLIGIHRRVRAIGSEQPDIKYLMLLGDDRIIPMARIPDFGPLPQEYDYVYTEGNISAHRTTVGQALFSNQYLSDDPLTVKREVQENDLGRRRTILLPELLAGRLVEDPEEIRFSLQTFLQHDGHLDLTTRDPDHRVLINAYDFLIDSGLRIRQRWKNTYGLEPDPDDLVPVDGRLISADWGEPRVSDRKTALLEHLQGHYGLMSLNGHATHFEAGIPGDNEQHIVGLETSRIRDELDFTGSVIYAVGCHSGLPVGDEGAEAEDHPLDLPQSVLGRGALGYVANSGYGWGDGAAVGYSERLVLNMTEILTEGPSAILGEAIREAKTRYYQADPRIELLDAKILLQWTLYGFPMTSLKVRNDMPMEQPAPIITLEPNPSSEQGPPLPPFLSRFSTTFEAPPQGAYTKYRANGGIVADGVEGCPTPADGEPEGCYYALYGQVVVEGDLPLEPLLVGESLIANASLHDVLWTGGSYTEELNWVPIVSEPISNGGGIGNPQALPRTTFIRPRGSFRGGPLANVEECRQVDSEHNQFVVVPANLRLDNQGQPTIHQLFSTYSFELFHYNEHEQRGTDSQCDRIPPTIGEGPYHRVDDGTVKWSVPILSDDTWRVVVVWDDQAADRWAPLDLTYDELGDRWIGSVTPIGNQRLTYFLQAVDTRGNVKWKEYQEPPDVLERKSGDDYRFLDLPKPFDVSLESLLFADDFESGDCSRWSGDC